MPRVLIRAFHVSRRTGDRGAVAPGDALIDERGQRVTFLGCSSPTKIRVRVRPGLELERPARNYGAGIREDVRSVPTAERSKAAEPAFKSPRASSPIRPRGDSPGRTSRLTDALAALRLLLGAQAPTLGEIAKALGRPRESVERILLALEEAGIEVSRVRAGKHTFLSVRRRDVLRTLGLQG